LKYNEKLKIMAIDFIENDEFFEFESKDLIIDFTLNFKSKFKIIDNNGYKLDIKKLYKRGVSKENMETLENIINKNFPISINDVSGLEIENFTIDRLYDGEFEINCYNNNFDLYLGDIIEK
jgi:hypothetical protein